LFVTRANIGVFYVKGAIVTIIFTSLRSVFVS